MDPIWLKGKFAWGTQQDNREFKHDVREVKHDVYGKRQTAKMKLLPSVFSCLYNRNIIFVFAVNSRRHFSIFV